MWLGHQYKDGSHITQYGKTDYWEGLTLNISASTRSQCISIENGELGNVRCGQEVENMGFICERQTRKWNIRLYIRPTLKPLDAQKCQPKDADLLPSDNRYFFSEEAAATTWSQARAQCQERGTGWDLAVIDDARGE